MLWLYFIIVSSYDAYMKNLLKLIFIIFVLPAAAWAFPLGAQEVTMPAVMGVRTDLLKNIAPLIQQSIAENDYPGAVVLAAHRGKIIYKGVFGNRRVLPNVAAMRFDTIFDIASLTKVVATTPAVMQLIEENKLNLDAPVAKYWPAFAAHGKQTITLRELLTHTSGLPADITSDTKNPNEVLRQIAQLKLTYAPKREFVYSDINFIVLAHVVEIVSGKSFDQYVKEHIFQPLAMNSTYFLPSASLRDRIAPTDMSQHHLRWGSAQDPMAISMGGVAGNAGLFSDANDLAIYAQCLLDNGRVRATHNAARYILGPLTILKMISPQTPPAMLDKRALGWDIDSVYSNRGELFPINSYGHTGWTGTSLWIDPSTQTWLIILTSRTHPSIPRQNKLIRDRRAIANIIAASITDISIVSLNNTGQNELNRAYKNINA
jgi:CubicO group peptidase (beta-lactamase class C family)